MKELELKRQMMILWKDTFHDSDEYVELIFDNYFNPEFIEYREEKGNVISALLGIPYSFGNGRHQIRGLYLCGLATKDEFRHRGIMNDLLYKINAKAASKGFHFSFLIPASESLRKYYYDRGYADGMYVVRDNYTGIHDFRNDYRMILRKEDERIEALKWKYYESLGVEKVGIGDTECIEDITGYIHKIESGDKQFYDLIHSGKDMEIVIRENHVSHGEIYVCRNKNREITGVAFMAIEENGRMSVPRIYHSDTCTYYRILDVMTKEHPDRSITVNSYPENSGRVALWDKAYMSSNPDGGMLESTFGLTERVYDVAQHSKAYGMIHILDFREILKFLADDRSDAKFSILVKDAINSEKGIICEVADGTATFKETIIVNSICDSPGEDDQSQIMITKKELADILFRRKDRSNIIREAMGIPRFPVNMSLLLD